MEKLFSLKGKNILVPGGAGYLGTAMCEALASYGATLFIASRNEDGCKQLAEHLANEYGVLCKGASIDVSSEESIHRCVKNILESHGRIDVMVNNAAFSVNGYFDDLTETMWKMGIDGTVNSVFRMCSAVLPHMERQGYGNIINISSMYGMVSPDPDSYRGEVRFNNPACYGAGKAAVLQLTRYIAGYYGQKGIRCNSISPGPFPSKEVQQTRWFVDGLANKTMLKRIGQPKDLAGVIVLLASDASQYITGTNICVDGGWTAW